MFQITNGIWQGRFPTRQRLGNLKEIGITHILNVGESPTQLELGDGPFVELEWIPIEDLVVIPQNEALDCIAALHRMVCYRHSRVYVHCVAGWNRSPTIVWLYLIACGVEVGEAINRIASSSYDAVPTHPKLINQSLVDQVITFGATNFLPHSSSHSIERPDN